MKKMIILLIISSLFSAVFSRTLKVGPGQTYSKIQDAINAASEGDTVKVLPGTYTDAIAVNKNIVVQGSGYEVTKIICNTDPAVAMMNGKIMWFAITSLSGDGIQIKDGVVTNCVITGCGNNGVYFVQNAKGILKNSVCVGNSYRGVDNYYVYGTVTNCIIWGNKENYTYVESITYTIGTTGTTNINSDPKFISGIDFHLSASSPGIDAGNPIEQDPDGSRCDIGYFGGIDCPTFPVVTKITLTPVGNGQIQIQATAKANY